MQEQRPSAVFVVVAAAFIVIAGGHGVGFLWMLWFWNPLGSPFIALLAAIGAIGALTHPAWRSPMKVLRASQTAVLVMIAVVFAMSEHKLLTFVTSLPSIGLAVWHMRPEKRDAAPGGGVE